MDKNVDKKKNFWVGAAMLFLGVIIGFMLAPMKKGVKIKNICGNGLPPEGLRKIDETDDFSFSDEDEF
ncbi:MAG: hypothetical protein RSA79_00480 [Oscillospiraceae bacterium]